MKSLLIDNWTIMKAIANIDTNYSSPEIKRIICFLVLWDEVYYLDNEHSSWWRDRIVNCEELAFLNELKPLKVSENMSAINQVYDEVLCKEETSIVAKGALEYLKIANDNDSHYVPVDERARFIEKYELKNTTFTRNEVLDVIDKEMLDYFKYSAEKIKAADMHLCLDSLYLMIRNTNSRDIVKSINHFKEKRMVKGFRNWIDRFENEIKAGKQLMIDEYLNELEEIQNMDPLEKLFGQMDISSVINLKLPLFPIVNGIKKINPKFVFPCYLYKKGISLAKDIVFPRWNIYDQIKNDC